VLGDVQSALSKQVTATPIAPADPPSGDDANPDDGEECEAGFEWVPTSQVCSMTDSWPSSSTEYSCDGDYDLVVTPVPFGTPLRQCKKSEPASSSTKYVCAKGYSLVTIPLGGQYCRKSVAATAKYSCPSGYARSGATCYKYTYRSLTGATCPAGYTVIYNGLYFLCRKKLTKAATATFSCSAGRLSGSQCVFTATPTSEPVYSCSAGRKSGSNCVLTGTLTTTVTYDCDDAPSGYTLSDENCVKTTTKNPSPTTDYYCDPGYNHDSENNMCSRTITTHACRTTYNPTITVTATGTTTSCTRTITIPAETGPPTCPAVPEGEPAYQLSVTDHGDGPEYTCTQQQDDDTTSTPPTQ